MIGTSELVKVVAGTVIVEVTLSKRVVNAKVEHIAGEHALEPFSAIS